MLNVKVVGCDLRQAEWGTQGKVAEMFLKPTMEAKSTEEWRRPRGRELGLRRQKGKDTGDGNVCDMRRR